MVVPFGPTRTPCWILLQTPCLVIVHQGPKLAQKYELRFRNFVRYKMLGHTFYAKIYS